LPCASLHWHAVPVSRSIGQDPARVMQTVTAVSGGKDRAFVPLEVAAPVVLGPPLGRRLPASVGLSDLLGPEKELPAGAFAAENWPEPPPRPGEKLSPDGAGPDEPTEPLPPPDCPPPGDALPKVDGPPGVMSLLCFGMYILGWVAVFGGWTFGRKSGVDEVCESLLNRGIDGADASAGRVIAPGCTSVPGCASSADAPPWKPKPPHLRKQNAAAGVADSGPIMGAPTATTPRTAAERTTVRMMDIAFLHRDIARGG